MKKTLLLLTLMVTLVSTLSLGAQRERRMPPITAFLQRFYTAYIRSIDRMLEQDQRDSIIATAVTPEMHEKLGRITASGGADPLLRAQDARAGLEKTFRARSLGGDWYEVSLGEPSEQVRIPMHVRRIGGRYRIDFITPYWHGEAYGDHLLANPLAGYTQIDNSSEAAFILSFYRRYLSVYLSLTKDMGAILTSLREQYCTLETIGLYRERTMAGDMEEGYYDVLIDNVDFDPAWTASLQVRPQRSGSGYEVTYTQSCELGPIQRVIPVRAVLEAGRGYRLQVLPTKGIETITPQAPARPEPQPQSTLSEEEAKRLRQEYGDH